MLDILASALILSATPSVGPGYVPPPSEYMFRICLNDPRTSLNVRSGPGTGFRKIGTIHHGRGVMYISRIVGQDGLWWAKVQIIGGGTGWVRDDYVCG